MALYPEVQKFCQEEVSDNLGSRPPTIDDVSSLPYVMATLMEIQRLAKVAPGSLTHMLEEDTQFGNYHFTKGTSFTANLTKFLMDPNVFESPGKFNPSRFLDENNRIKRYEQFVPFGIGKRICMGETLAKNEMFIFFVRLLQRVFFEETENKLSIDNVTFGITRIPNAFEVKVRSL